MGNQVCCTSGANEFEHFQQVHNYNRRNRGHSHHRDEMKNETSNGAYRGQAPAPTRKDRSRAGAIIDNPRSVSPNVRPTNIQKDKEFKAMFKQMQDQKMKCLLVDKYSLDFSKPFNPPNKSALALAAMQNKNGCRISSKSFIAFQTGISSPSMAKSPEPLSAGTQNLALMTQLEREYSFQIKFLDFSQRRKVGFRGAFEFDTKRILIANDRHIKILAYFQNLDGSQLLQTVKAKRQCRSRSPATPAYPRRGQVGQSHLSYARVQEEMSKSRDLSAGFDTRARHQQFWDTESASTRAHREDKPSFKQSKNTQSKQPKKEADAADDARLASFEIASFELPDYPNEKINFVKFLDGNDPRLLFLVTYNTQLRTTYMKVVKIEKSKPLAPSMSLASQADADVVNATGSSRLNRQRSFSLLESQPFTELKKEIIDHQMNSHKQQQSGNPNAADSNQTGLYMPNGAGFRTHENLKAMLKPNAKKQCMNTADLQITSMSMAKPIKMKADWDPQSNFEELVLQQIDEMERQEFQQDRDVKAPDESSSAMQDGLKTANNLREEAQQQQEAAQDIIKERTGALRLGGIKKAPKSGVPLQYELIQSKLGKFKNTELKVLYFGSAFTGGQGTNGGTTSRAKQMISVDQNCIYRVHKVKGIKMMADKDFLLSTEDFPDGEDPKKIQNLKAATYRQLKEVQLVAEYVFCSLLQSSRLNCLDPVQIQTSTGVNGLQIAKQELSSPIPREVAMEDSKEGQEQIKSDAETTAESPQSRNQEAKVQVEKVIFHQGVVVASLTIERLNQPSTFKQTVIKQFSMLSSEPEAGSGRSLDLNSQYFAYNKKYMSSIDFLKIPRLDWDDRRIEYEIAADKSNGQDGPQAVAGQKDASLQPVEAKNGSQATPRLPKKLIVSGKYKNLPKKENKNQDDSSSSLKAQREWPFVALVDTQLLEKRTYGAAQDFTMIKCFQYEVEGKAGFFKKGQEQQSKLNLEITALNYGPYDNGHIILGFNNGHILILNSLDLASMFRLQVFEPLPAEICSPKLKIPPQSNELEDKVAKSETRPMDQYLPISKIQFDPTQMILVSSEVPHSLPQETTIPTAAQSAHPGYARYNLAGITLIEKVTQYKYIDMGQDTFMTLVIPKDENKGGKPKNLSPSFEGAGLC